MPVVGFLSSRSSEETAQLVEAFKRGLAEDSFVDGRNVAIEYRWAKGHYDRLPAQAADLVARRVTVLVAVGGDPSPLAAKHATSTIPIVFGMGSDPTKPAFPG
jgi:putative ABC transport system substrate-binding protein